MRTLQELWRAASAFEMKGMDGNECLEAARGNLTRRAGGAVAGGGISECMRAEPGECGEPAGWQERIGGLRRITDLA